MTHGRYRDGALLPASPRWDTGRRPLSLAGYIAGAVAVCALAAASCGGADPPAPAAAPRCASSRPPADCRPEVGSAPLAAGTVSTDDPALLREVRILPPARERVTCHRLLRLTIPIQNASDRPLRVAVQLEFLDRDRAFYGDRTTRRVLELAPGATEHFVATSLKQKACRFMLLLTRP